MADKTLLDVISRPLVRRLIVYGGSAIIGAIVTTAHQHGWLDAVGAKQLGDALNAMLSVLAQNVG